MNQFCLRHKNRREHNQHFKLLFFEINLCFQAWTNCGIEGARARNLRRTQFFGDAYFALWKRKKILDLQIYSRIGKKWTSYSEFQILSWYFDVHTSTGVKIVLSAHGLRNLLTYFLGFSRTFSKSYSIFILLFTNIVSRNSYYVLLNFQDLIITDLFPEVTIHGYSRKTSENSKNFKENNCEYTRQHFPVIYRIFQKSYISEHLYIAKNLMGTSLSC